MVLDAKAMTWAAQHELDTAKLKKAGIPIYGKWYFPEIPAETPMVNLETGERQVFQQRMLAGEVIYVAEADLRRPGLVELPWPEVEPTPPGGAPGAAPPVLAGGGVEPLLALARPPEEVA